MSDLSPEEKSPLLGHLGARPEQELVPCDFSGVFCQLSKACGERKKPHIFRKLYILSRGGLLLTEIPRDPKEGPR